MYKKTRVARSSNTKEKEEKEEGGTEELEKSEEVRQLEVEDTCV